MENMEDAVYDITRHDTDDVITGDNEAENMSLQ